MISYYRNLATENKNTENVMNYKISLPGLILMHHFKPLFLHIGTPGLGQTRKIIDGTETSLL